MRYLASLALAASVSLLAACSSSKGPGPKWYYQVPTAKGAIFGVGVSEEVFSEQLARESAQLNATKEVSKVMSQRISGMVDNFLRQAALGNEAERNATTQSVARALMENNLVGVVIDKCEPGPVKDKNNYKFYCMAKYEINSKLAEQLDQKLQQNSSGKVSEQALLDAYRAKQGFEEMKKELEKMRQEAP